MSGLAEIIATGVIVSLILKWIWKDEYPVPKNKYLRVIVKIIYTIVTIVFYIVLIALVVLGMDNEKLDKGG